MAEPETAVERAGVDLSGMDVAALDRLAASFAERAGQPGLAYGIVARGALAHSGGAGERWLGGSCGEEVSLDLGEAAQVHVAV